MMDFLKHKQEYKIQREVTVCDFICLYINKINVYARDLGIKYTFHHQVHFVKKQEALEPHHSPEQLFTYTFTIYQIKLWHLSGHQRLQC